MTSANPAFLQNWKRLRSVVRATAAVVDANPEPLAAVKPLVTRALELLAESPSPDAIDEIEYNVQRTEQFVARWRPSGRRTSGVLYIPPSFARDTDRECEEALRLLQEIRKASAVFETKENPRETTMKVFVSHSSVDKKMAASFVELLRAALLLPAKDIRCTSVDGYKLAPGASSDEQLRQEVFDAEAFVALLSPKSIQSMYVMFELGARWGTKKPFAPVMVGGLDPSFLKPPLSAMHAVAGTSEGDMHQLVQTLADWLHMTPEGPNVYVSALQTFVNEAKPSP